MKIHVDFTVDVDVSAPESRAALLEVSASSDLAGARDFVKSEAQTMLAFYLATNGVRVIGNLA